jgi:predicted cation transporter
MHSIPQEPVLYIVLGLAIVALVVLIAPFKIRIIEKNLEIFFLVIGIIAVTISGLWSWELIIEALKAPVMIGSVPIGIFQVVLVFGLLIHYFNKPFYRFINRLIHKIGMRAFVFVLVIFLGLFSSIISVIVTACILAEIAAALPIDNQTRLRLVVITCFSVALGACLTPIGEPLSTIMVAKLAGEPYYADFLFPFKILGKYVIPGVIAVAAFGAYYCGENLSTTIEEGTAVYSESLRTVIIRAVKVFAFVAALILLGEGFKPIIVWFFGKIPWWLLYWINSISSILDNATLTAIEIGPSMGLSQIVAIILGLSIAGGMMIPGNIPNIVAAARLNIRMVDWARIGLPIGGIIMAIFFVALLIVTLGFNTI